MKHIKTESKQEQNQRQKWQFFVNEQLLYQKNRGREMVFLTVFTPAYNRASTLPRTYESLCDQECKEFIWLIVDDGSTDETASLVKEWQKKENGFEIQYIYKKTRQVFKSYVY